MTVQTLKFMRSAGLGLAILMAGALPATLWADDTRVGGTIEVTGVIDDDLNIMGGDIEVDAEVRGDLSAVGGDISVRGRIDGDIDVIGGQVDIDAEVGQDVSVAGGDVTIGPNAKIDGELEAAGGDVEVAGSVGRGIEAAAAEFTLSGTVTGDVDIRGRKIRIAPGARITGDLIVKGPNEPDVAPGTVGGQVKYTYAAGRGWRGYDYGWDGEMGHRFDFEFSVLSAIWALFIGLLLIYLFPNLTERTAKTLRVHPLRSFGFGLLGIIFIPALAVLLIITVIGLPLGLLLLMLFPVLLFLGFLSTALGLARMIHGDKDGAPSKFTQLAYLAVVLLALTLVSLIPIVSDIVALIAVIVGIGAFGAALFNYDEDNEDKAGPNAVPAA